MGKPNLLWELEDPALENQYPIRLLATGKTFTVEYGLDHRHNLDYAGACSAIGTSIMHALTCQGLVEF